MGSVTHVSVLWIFILCFVQANLASFSDFRAHAEPGWAVCATIPECWLIRIPLLFSVEKGMGR